MDSLDQTFAALADTSRRGAVDLLAEEPMCSGELADALEISPQSMSRHLRVLRRAGLVRETIDPDDARVRVYELCEQPFGDLNEWLKSIEAFWSEQLSSFKKHVEGKR